MKPDGDRPGATGYMNSSAGTSLLSDHAPRRLPQEWRFPRDLAKAATDAAGSPCLSSESYRDRAAE